MNFNEIQRSAIRENPAAREIKFSVVNTSSFGPILSSDVQSSSFEPVPSRDHVTSLLVAIPGN